LHKTYAPAAVSEAVKEKALQAAKTLADKVNVVGTFTIEMFVKGEAIYINEMAPRPHNSGHYTIEACNVSQFSQHIRAICGLPLPEVEQLKIGRASCRERGDSTVGGIALMIESAKVG